MDSVAEHPLYYNYCKSWRIGRPPSWAIISASTNIFAPNLVQTYNDGKSQPKATYCSESFYRKSKITDGRHLEFKKVIIIQSWICLEFCMMVDSDSGKLAVCITLKQQIGLLYRKTLELQCI